MPDLTPLATLLLGLIATLLVAGFSFYQWRRRSLNPGGATSLESRQRAAEALWARLEDANFRMRDNSLPGDQACIKAQLRDVNAVLAKNARHLDDPVQVMVRAYVSSLHRAAQLLRENHSRPAVDWVDTSILPIACGDAKLVEALQDLALQRDSVKRALLGAQAV